MTFYTLLAVYSHPAPKGWREFFYLLLTLVYSSYFIDNTVGTPILLPSQSWPCVARLPRAALARCSPLRAAPGGYVVERAYLRAWVDSVETTRDI